MSIKIDNVDYPVEWVKNTFTVSAEIMNGGKSGRLKNRSMFLQYLGTFYNFSGTIVRERRCSDREWDDFFDLLSDYENVHNIEVPFLQGYMKCNIYISSVSRKYISWKKLWKNTIDVKLTPMISQARAADFKQTGVIAPLLSNNPSSSYITPLSDYIAPGTTGTPNGNNFVRGYYWGNTERPPWDL